MHGEISVRLGEESGSIFTFTAQFEPVLESDTVSSGSQNPKTPKPQNPNYQCLIII
jgi:hypothetical protein